MMKIKDGGLTDGVGEVPKSKNKTNDLATYWLLHELDANTGCQYDQSAQRHSVHIAVIVPKQKQVTMGTGRERE